MPVDRDSIGALRTAAVRRLGVVACHVAGAAAEPTHEVTFDEWQTTDPIVAPAPGREAWKEIAIRFLPLKHVSVKLFDAVALGWLVGPSRPV